MNNYFRLEQQIEKLQNLCEYLKRAPSIEGKLKYLNSLPAVQHEYASNAIIQNFSAELSQKEEYVTKLVIAIGQGPIVFNHHTPKENHAKFRPLLNHLLELELS